MVVSLDETEKKVYAALLSKNTPLTANELAKITGLKPDEVTQAINKLLDMKILRTLQEKGFPDLYFPMPPSRLIQQTTSKSYSDIESALEGTTNLINSLKEGLSTSLDELHSGITEIPASIETILRDYNDIFRESSKSMIASKSDQYRNVLNEITKKGSQSLQDSRKKLQDSVAENYDVVIKGLSSSTSKLDSTTEQMNRLLIEYHNEFDGIIHDTVKHFEDALHGASSSISEVILNLEKSLTTNLRDSFSAQGTAQEAVLETVQKTLEEDSNTASSSLDEAKSRVKSLQKRLDDGITNSLTTLTQQLETLTEDKKEDIYQFLESRIKEIGKEITEKISVVQESSNTRMIKHLEKIDATKEQLSTFSTTTVPKTISGFSDALVRETKTIFQSLDVEIEKNLRLFEGMAFDFLENSRKDSREAVEDLLAQFSKLMNENIEFLESEFKTIEKSARDWKKTSVTVRNQLEELETAIVKRVEKYETSSKDLIDSHQNRIKEITGAINKNFETGIQEDVIKIREKLNTLFDSLKSGNVTRYESNVKALRGLQKDVVTTKDELISKFNENSEKHSETLKANLGTTLEGIEGIFQEQMSKFKEEFGSMRSNFSIKLSETESNIISLNNSTKKGVKSNILTAKSELGESLQTLPEKVSTTLDEALDSIKRAFDEVKQSVENTVNEGMTKASKEFDKLTTGVDTLLDSLSSTSSEYLKDYTENFALLSADSEARLANIFDEKINSMNDLLTSHRELSSELTSSTGTGLDDYLEKVILKVNETSNSIGESLSEFSSYQDTSFSQISQETENVLSNVDQHVKNALALTSKAKKDFTAQLGTFQQEITGLKTENIEQIGSKINDSIKAVETDIDILSKLTSEKFAKEVKENRSKLEEAEKEFTGDMKTRLTTMDSLLISVHEQGRQSVEKSLAAQKEIGTGFSEKIKEVAQNTASSINEQLSAIITSTSDSLTKATKMTQEDRDKVLNNIKEEAQSITGLLSEEYIGKIKENNLKMIESLLTAIHSQLEELKGQVDTSVGNLGTDVIDTLQEINDSHLAINDEAMEKINAISKNFTSNLSKREEGNIGVIRDNTKKLAQPIEVLVEMMSLKSTEEIKSFIQKVSNEKDSASTSLKEFGGETSALLKQIQETSAVKLDQVKKDLETEERSAAKIVEDILKQTGDFFESEISKAISEQLEENREKLLVDSVARMKSTKETTEKWKNESQQTVDSSFQEFMTKLSTLRANLADESDTVEKSLNSIEEFSLKIDAKDLSTIRQLSAKEDFEIYADGLFSRTKDSLVIMITDKNDLPLDLIEKLGTKIRVRIVTNIDITNADDKKWATKLFNTRTGATLYGLPAGMSSQARSIVMLRDNAEILLSLADGDNKRFSGISSNNPEIVDVFNQLLGKLALQGSKKLTKKQVF